jgi:hypothetical protein
MAHAKSPHLELIEPDNDDVFSSLTPAAWAAFSEAWAEAVFFDLRVVQQQLRASLRRTGSIASDHRKDMVETLKAAKPASVALGITAPPEANGAAQKPRVGLP